MEKVKYYQLSEKSSEANSIGVVKSVNGVFDLELLNYAISSHFALSLEILEIKESGVYGEIDIKIKFTDNDAEWEDIIEGVETWLYLE